MADGDVVRNIKIVATGEGIDQTTQATKTLGDATDKAAASATASNSAWVDAAAKSYLVGKAYEIATAAATSYDSALKSLGQTVHGMSQDNTGLSKLFLDTWQEGIDKIASYVALNEKAGKLGTDFYQQITKGAEDLLKVIDNLNAALRPTLGTNGLQNGSTFNTLVTGMQKDGNLQGQTADVNSLNNAVTNPEKLAAAQKLLHDMAEDGQTLGSLKIAGTLLGPEAAANLQNDSYYLEGIKKSFDAVKTTDLIKQADIDRAVSMTIQFDASKTIIDAWFTKSTSDWSGLGIEIQQLWLNAQNNFASILTTVDAIFARTKDIASVKADPNNSIWTKIGDYFNDGTVQKMTDVERALEVAKQTLGSQLQNPQNVKNNISNLQSASDKLSPDTSSPAGAGAGAIGPEKIDNTKDAYDRAVESVLKYIEVTKAAAASTGLGSGEQEKAKITAQLYAAAIKDGLSPALATAKSLEGDFGEAAKKASDALTDAKLKSDASRGNQLLFASAEDVKIADQLKAKYGDDIPRALASTEAATIRMHDSMKTLVDDIKNMAGAFGNDLVQGILSGKGAMDSLTAAAGSLGKSLTSAGINNIIKDPTSVVGYAEAGIGIVTEWITGNSEKKKQEEAARQAAAAAAAKAVQDGLDRSAAFNAQANTASVDTSTVAGQIAAFDINAQQQRAAEAKAGNQAILALENDLAVQRQSIIDKANQAIAKTMNDFLLSIKTGSLSTLSPEDQLKAAQSQFSSDVTGAKSGNQDAISRITADASNLLNIAKSFYASTSGYTSIYQGVTDAVSSLANTKLLSASPDANITSQAVAQLDKFGPSKGFASGGYVSNGSYGVDSVMARLAGGEHVTRSSSVNAATRSSLDYINRTGNAPGSDDVVRVLTQGFNNQTSVLSDKLDNIASRVQSLENTTRNTSNQRRVPGTQKAA
jgi:hypothetical protein